MFFISVTNSNISKKFQFYNVNEFEANSMIITVFTDGFLSKIFSEPDGFSVVEAPFISYGNYEDFTFLKIDYDNIRKEIHIVKSILCGRELYYQVDPKGNFYCSSHISLLKKAGIKIEENTSAISEYFMYSYIAPPKTFYKNIIRLSSENQLIIKILNKKCKIKSIKYFDFKKSLNQVQSIDVISKKLSRYLSNYLKKLKLVSDKCTVLLSGGIDSSILFKIFEKYFPIEITYSTGYPFEAPSKNIEKKYALSASEYFQTKHKYVEFTMKEYLYGLIEGISIAEEPLQTQAILFHLLFKKGILKNKKIIICGQGADAIFGVRLLNDLFKKRNSMKYIIVKNKVIMKLISFMLTNIKKISLAESTYDLFQKFKSIEDVNNRQIEGGYLWSLGDSRETNWVYDYFNVSKKDVIKHRLNLIKPYMTDSIYKILTILDLFDHIQNTQSIISKFGEKQNKIILFPYTDSELIDYVLSIPWKIKLKRHKNILRNLARLYDIPEFIINRPKSGIEINRKDWAIKDGPFEPLIPMASKIFNEKYIRKMQSTNVHKALTFWKILNYAIWKRICINNESVEDILSEIKA